MNDTSVPEMLEPGFGVEAELPEYLDLLARVKKALATARPIDVPFGDIRPYKGQPREYFNPDGIRRLSASIKRGGQTQRGMVREKPADFKFEIVDTGTEVVPRRVVGSTRYEQIDGERRWRSVGLIPEADRPLYRAELIEAEDDVIQYLISGITNFNRDGHTAIETMKTIDRHLQFKFPMDEVAKLLGISEHWAYQIHGLKKLSPDVAKLLDPTLPKPQQLPVIAAIHISKIEPKLQMALAVRVINKDVTLSRLRGEVVRVGIANNAPVRTRALKADAVWTSLGNKIRESNRVIGDAEDLLVPGELDRFIRKETREVEALINQMDEIEGTIARIKQAFKRSSRSK